MSGNWTPGPWRAEVVRGWGSDPVIAADAWPEPVATMVPHGDRYYRHVKREIRGEMYTTFVDATPEGEARKAEVDAQLIANAHLIAAAPTMADYVKRKADEGCAEAASILVQINAR